jgi:flagellar assembly protein FliH
VVRLAPESALQPWRAPDLHDGTRPMLPAEEREARRGYDEGFAKGYQDGLQEAEREMSASVKQIAAFTESLRQPVEKLADHVDDELVRLTLAIARQVIRRELRSDPDQIATMVKAARASLSNVQGILRISLHPDDAPLVRRMFSDEQSLESVQILEDPSISRGGCGVSSDTSFVDATVETRIARLAVQLLGDERESGAANPRRADP